MNKYNFAKNPSSVIRYAEFIAHCFKKPRAKEKAAGSSNSFVPHWSDLTFKYETTRQKQACWWLLVEKVRFYYFFLTCIYNSLWTLIIIIVIIYYLWSAINISFRYHYSHYYPCYLVSFHISIELYYNALLPLALTIYLLILRLINVCLLLAAPRECRTIKVPSERKGYFLSVLHSTFIVIVWYISVTLNSFIILWEN